MLKQAHEKTRLQDMRGGRWLLHCDTQSTEFELRNIAHEVMQHAHEWSGKPVLVVTDNVGAAHIVGKGCQKNAQLHAASLQLWTACMRHDVALSTQWLCGDRTILSGADGLSMGQEVYDCTLATGAFTTMWEWAGPLEMDCCAMPGAVQHCLDTGMQLDFVSPFGEGACWSDVMSFQHDACTCSRQCH